MRLIGMLDSPYVRRVAVALLHAGAPFEHQPLSVFRHFDAYAALSPMVKAPSLIADNGAALVDSSVILDYVAFHSPALAAMRPQSLAGFRALGLALTVMEKAVQLHYERALRGAGEKSESWRARVTRQLDAGLAQLDDVTSDSWFDRALGHADIAAACAWGFCQGLLADVVPAQGRPRLAALAARAEALPAFRAAPAVDGVVAGERA